MNLPTSIHQVATSLAQAAGNAASNDPVKSIIGRFDGLISQLAALLIMLAYPLILIGIVLAGYKYITGDPKGGKAGLMAAIVGAAIFIFARVLITTVTGIVTD